MQNLTTIGLPFGKLTRWFTTHVDSVNGHIFCQLTEPSISVKYERLYQAINGWAKAGRIQKIAVSPKTGELCLTQYPVDKKWYRSQITHVNTEYMEVEVYFLDYGNSEVVSFEFLYDLPTQFAEVCPHANECILADVEPVMHSEKWSERAIELINELVFEQELPGIPVRLYRSLLVLKLYADQDGTVTVANQLISAGFGQEKFHSSSSNRASVNGSIARSNSVSSGGSSSSKKSGNSSSSMKNMTYKKFNFTEEQYLDLCVVYCEDISNFFCQPISAADELISLQKQIQKMYSKSTETVPMKKFKLNQACCARFEEDSQWYRGLVKRIGTDSCLIYFVDYGNTESVSLRDIRELNFELYTLPVMAIECSLNGIIPLPGEGHFSTNSKEMFESWTIGNKSMAMVGFVFKILNGKADLILYDKDDKSINQKLIQKGLVASSVEKAGGPIIDSVSIENKSNVASSNSIVDTNSTSKIKYVDLTLRIGQEELSFVSYSYNPHYFFVNLLNTKDSLDKLMSDIAVYTSSNKLDELKNPLLGYACLTFFSEDNQYYRGEIIDINGDEAEISFVDYGNKEIKKIAELKSIRKEFIKLPRQAIQCKLNGCVSMSSDGIFSSNACEKFEELTIDKNLIMTVTDISSGNLLSVDLLEENLNHLVTRIDICTALVQSGFVIQQKAASLKVDYGEKVTSDATKYGELKVDLNCYIDVSPVDVHDPGQFCCHVVQNVLEFKKMVEDINEFYSQSIMDRQITWKKMMPCVALYDVDDCWYRALIASCIGSDSVEVTFVDFGNSAIVPMSSLRPIYQYFMELDAQVFVCGIADVSPRDKSWSDEAIDGFQNFVKDKHLTAYIKSKKENNLYSVVLYDTRNSPEVNIAQWLIQMHHAVSTEVSDAVLPCAVNIKPNDKEEVYVTAVKNPGDFWLQLNRLSTELDEMMEKIYDFYSQLKPSDYCILDPIIGQYCCAQYSGDEGWYRAFIEEVQGKSIHVRYIDYGNTETVSVSKIKVLSTEFDCFPSYALPCHLSGLQAYPSWDTSVNSLLLDETFDAQFINKSTPSEVQLKADGKLLSRELEALVGTTQCQVETHAITEKREEQHFDDANVVIKECLFEIGEKVEMRFLQASSPHDFYCQLLDTRKQFGILEDQITGHVRSQINSSKFNGKAGGYCLAMSSEFGRWCRAEIFDKSKDGVNVQFVDYGNEEYVAGDNIMALPVPFASLCKQAALCSLSCLEPVGSEWANGAIELMESICLNKTLTMEIDGNQDGKFDVRVHDSNSKADIADKLFKAGLATYVRSSSVSSGNSRSSIPSEPAISYKQPVIARKESGYCTFVQSGCSVNIQLTKYEDELKELMENLGSICITAKSAQNIRVGSVCAASFSEDNAWYRAKVTSLDGDSAMVHFVDYGNNDLTSRTALKELPSSFLELPQTCITFSLNDVHERNIDLQKCEDWLEKNVIDELLNIEVLSSTNATIAEGTLFLESENINQKLFEKFGAELTKGSPETINDNISIKESGTIDVDVGDTAIQRSIPLPDLTSESIYNAICYVVESAVVLKCQLSNNQDMLNILMDEIYKASESCEMIKSPLVGQICMSKFEENWYRARVVAKESSNFSVEFVDYGNIENVPASDIKYLPSEFISLPQSCISVTLNDVHMEDIDASATKSWLEKTIIEKVVKVEVVSLLDSLSVSAYVYIEGMEDDHINDQIYFNFSKIDDELPTEDGEVVEAKEIVNEQQLSTKDEEMVNKLPNHDEAKNDIPYHDSSKSSSPSEGIIGEELSSNLKNPILKSEMNGECRLFKPHCITAGDAIKAYSTHVDLYNKRIQLQMCQFAEDLDILMEGIANLCAIIPNVCCSVVVGMPCLSLFKEDELWYRAEVVAINGEDVTVLYVDYGNTDVLNPSQIYDIPNQFLLLPKTCVPFGIRNIDEINLNLESVQTFFEEMIDVEVALKVLDVSENGILYGDLYCPTLFTSTFNQALLEKFGTISENNDQEKSNVLCAIPDTCEKETGYCTLIKSATCVTIQLVKYEDQLSDIMVNLKRYCKTADNLQNVQVGNVCAALYTDDGECYRAEVIHVDDRNITVNFIDYGNVEIVSIDDLKSLTPVFLDLPRTCISCYFLDVHENDLNTTETVPWLEEHVLGQVLNITNLHCRTSGDFEGYLYLSDSEIHINDILYEKFFLENVATKIEKNYISVNKTDGLKENDFANLNGHREELCEEVDGNQDDTNTDNQEVIIPLSDEKLLPEKNEILISTMGDKSAVPITKEIQQVILTQNETDIDQNETSLQKKEFEIPPPELIVNTTYAVTSCFTNSPIEIQCQLLCYQEKLEALMCEMAASAEQAPLLTHPEIGQLCMAKYSVDEAWYRGRLIGKERVEFIDYGNIEEIPSSHIKELSTKFIVLPKTCISVTLHDVHLADIDSDATKSWIDSTLPELLLKVEVINILDPTSVSAYIYEEGSDYHINDQIYELFALEEEGMQNGNEDIPEVEVSNLPEQSEITVALSCPEEIKMDEDGVQENIPIQEDPTVENIVSSDLEIPFPEMTSNTVYGAVCYYVEAADKLKCQLLNYQEKLYNLMDKMAVTAIEAPVLETLAVGQLCLTKANEREGYYRGRIIDEGKVELIDYGYVEDLTDNIREICPEFVSLPQAGVSVVLHDVHLTDIDTDRTKSWLTENLLERVVKIEIISILDSSSVSAYVYKEGNDDHVNDEIYELFGIEEDIVASSDLVLPILPVDTQEIGTCTFIESAINIKFQLSKYESDLHTLSSTLHNYCEVTEACGVVTVGEFCVARYSVDNSWYRAQVLCTDGDEETITVEFVDLGKTEKVMVSRTRPISSDHLSLPRCCIDIHLDSISVSDIEASKAKIWLEDKLSDQRLLIHVKSTEFSILRVCLYVDKEEMSINDQINSIFSVNSQEITSKEIQEIQDNETLGNCAMFTPPIVNGDVSALCTYVDSPIQFTCRLSTFEDEFKSICSTLERQPSEGHPVKSVSTGDAVIVKSSLDGSWYRGKILKQEEAGILVRFVDIGYSEICSIENIGKVFDKNLFKFSTCATFTLQDVYECDIDGEKCQEWLEEVCIDKMLTLKVNCLQDESYLTYAYFNEGETENSINDLIYEKFPLDYVEDDEIEEGCPSSDSNCDKEVGEIFKKQCAELPDNGTEDVSVEFNEEILLNSDDIDNKQTDVSAPPICSKKEFSWPVFTEDSSEDVVFTVIENATTLRCQLTKYQDKLDRLMNLISVDIDDLPGVRFLEKGDPCIAQYEDLCWYRGRILSTLDSTAKVEFVDYGNIDDIITEDLRVIKPEMLVDHIFCIKCILSNVHVTDENQDDATEYLSKTLVEDAPVVSIVINGIDYEKEVVMVTLNQRGININAFIQKYYGPVETVFRDHQITLGDKLELTALQASTLSNFPCTLNESKGELELLMGNLSQHYGQEDESDRLSNIEIGFPCCALGVTENRWYRGMVKEIGETINVLFVDYGFSEDLPPRNIYKLEPYFFQLEVQSIQCRLFNLLPVKESESWSIEAVQYFNDICREQNLTATVINNADQIYTVALAFESGETVYEMLTREHCILSRRISVEEQIE